MNLTYNAPNHRFPINRAVLAALLTIVILWPVGALAGEAGEKIKDKPEDRSITADPDFQRRIDLTEEGLVHAVDLWYDAVVKDDRPLCARYERLITNIFKEDIWATEMELSKIKVSQKQGERFGEEQIRALEDSEQMLSVKQKLLTRFVAAATFADRYRLLGEYINALRKELGMPKLELAYLDHLEQLDK